MLKFFLCKFRNVFNFLRSKIAAENKRLNFDALILLIISTRYSTGFYQNTPIRNCIVRLLVCNK